MSSVLGQVVIGLTANTSQLVRATNRGGTALRGYVQQVRRVDRQIRQLNRASHALGRSLSTVGSLAAGGFIAIGGLSPRSVIQDFLDLDTQLVQYQTQIGLSADETARARQEIEQLSRYSGENLQGIASALFSIFSAGERGASAFRTLRAVVDGAIIGIGELATIADVATAANQAFGRSAIDVVSALRQIVEVGVFSDPEALAASFNTAAQASAGLGVSLEDLSAAFATVSLEQRKAERTGTQLRSLMAALGSASGRLVEIFSETGNTSEALDRIRDSLANNGLLPTLRFISERAEQLNLRIAQVITNVRARAAFETIIRDADRADRVFGRFQNSFARFLESVGIASASLERKLKVQLQAIRLEMQVIAQSVIPPVINNLEFFIASMIRFTGVVIIVLSPLRRVVSALTTMAISAVKGGSAIALFSRSLRGLLRIVGRLLIIYTVVEVIIRLGEAILNTIKLMSQLELTFVQAFGGSLLTIVRPFINIFIRAGELILDTLSIVAKAALDLVFLSLDTVARGFRSAFDKIVELVKDAGGVISAAFSGRFTEALNLAEKFLQDIGDDLSGAGATVADKFAGGFVGGINAFTGAAGAGFTRLTTFLNDLVIGSQEGADAIKNRLEQLGADAGDAAGAAAGESILAGIQHTVDEGQQDLTVEIPVAVTGFSEVAQRGENFVRGIIRQQEQQLQQERQFLGLEKQQTVEQIAQQAFLQAERQIKDRLFQLDQQRSEAARALSDAIAAGAKSEIAAARQRFDETNREITAIREGANLLRDDLQSITDELGEVRAASQDVGDGTFDGIIAEGGELDRQVKSIGRAALDAGASLSSAFARAAVAIRDAIIEALILEPILRRIREGIGGATGGAGLLGLIPGFQGGGITPGGLVLVGERGPEIIQTSNPARVYNNEQLRDALGNRADGVVLNFSPTFNTDNPALIRAELDRALPRFTEAARASVQGDLTRATLTRRLVRGR